jgi:hypothetical protein
MDERTMDLRRRAAEVTAQYPLFRRIVLSLNDKDSIGSHKKLLPADKRVRTILTRWLKRRTESKKEEESLLCK